MMKKNSSRPTELHLQDGQIGLYFSGFFSLIKGGDYYGYSKTVH